MYSKLYCQYSYDSGNKSRQELSESVPRDAAGEGVKRCGGIGVWLEYRVENLDPVDYT
jgi:hypothetical protein